MWGQLREIAPMLAKFCRSRLQDPRGNQAQGLYKTGRIITGPQNAEIPIADGRRVINLCTNNYLGLADHPALIATARQALDSRGLMANDEPADDAAIPKGPDD